MNGKQFLSIARILVALTVAVGTGVLAQAPTPGHLSGIISDYTPLNAGATPTGPYEMRGHWSVNVDPATGKANFSAFMTMELSDYWVLHSNSDASNPAIRGAHTHHINLTGATIVYNPTGCPTDSPATTARFMISGTAKFITGNGNPGPFEKNGPTTVHVCVTGGSDVRYSNMTMTLVGPATGHFGTQPIHGVVRFPHSEDSDSDQQ
jgi:hypothetical protein